MNWNEFIENVKPTAEVLSFITNIGLFTTVIIGIKQLKMVKEDNHTRNERASKEKSIEYLKWFSSEYALEIEELIQKLNSIQVEKYKGPISFSFKYTSELDTPEVNKYILFTRRYNATELLNKLEYFSTGVISGIANKEMLVKPLARTFSAFVILMYPTICWSRRHDDNAYSAIVELFNEWILTVAKDGELTIKESGEIISKVKYKNSDL